VAQHFPAVDRCEGRLHQEADSRDEGVEKTEPGAVGVDAGLGNLD